jgi:hypothetical protein
MHAHVALLYIATPGRHLEWSMDNCRGVEPEWLHSNPDIMTIFIERIRLAKLTSKVEQLMSQGAHE